MDTQITGLQQPQINTWLLWLRVHSFTLQLRCQIVNIWLEELVVTTGTSKEKSSHRSRTTSQNHHSLLEEEREFESCLCRPSAVPQMPWGAAPMDGAAEHPQPFPKPARHCHTRPAQPLCTCSSTHPLQPPLRSIPTRCSSRSRSPVKNIPLFK